MGSSAVECTYAVGIDQGAVFFFGGGVVGVGIKQVGTH